MASADHEDRSAASRILRTVERRAQRRAGLIRIILAATLYSVIALATEGLPESETATWRQVEAGKVFLAVFAATGVVVYGLARKGIGTHVLPYATAAVDAAIVLGNLIYNHVSAEIPGNLTVAFPVVWVVPIALAANAIYFRPGLQVFVTLIYVAGLALISWWAGYVGGEQRLEAMARLQASFGFPPNSVRLAMLLSAGLLLVLAAFQGRRLLNRVVHETVTRMSLTRYLPRELAPFLADDAFAELRAGRRIQAALLFVDIRASSARAATMDPALLARFITAFRSRVGRAAAQHGGVVDKFIGDGALIVFGVPRPGEGDVARALACARTLVALVEDWNGEERFEAPVEIGVGVHCGEVFCGVVGEEERLEFTVLGDAVNVAARLEQATKTLGGPILASAEAVEAAGEPGSEWREVSRECLPGLGRPIALMCPAKAAA